MHECKRGGPGEKAQVSRRSLPMTKNERTYEQVVCGHCEGLGCLYCNKTGSVLVAAPKRKCGHCEGAGCIYCGFTGWAEPKGKYD
jgi:hypothetical protein